MVDLSSHGTSANRLRLFMIFLFHLSVVNLATVKKDECSAGNVCETAECNNTAQQILQYMNTDVSPCTNFYQFVCGNFDSDGNTIIFGYDHSVMGDLGGYVTSMTEYFLRTKAGEKINEPFRQAFELFQACSDQDAMREKGVSDLQEIIEKIGGWPLVEGSEWKQIRWESVSRPLTELGYDSGLFFDVKITQIGGPTIQMNPVEIEEFYSKTWDKLMVVATKLGADPNTLPSVDSKNHLHSFRNPARKDSSGYMTIDEMITRWPSIDWMTYFTGVFAALPDVTIEGDQGVLLPPEYIDELVLMLNITHPSFIMNYVVAKVVEYSLQYLSPDVPSHPGKGIVNYDQAPAQRRARCAYIVSEQLPLMVEALYEVNYVNDHLRNTIMNLSSELTSQLGELISGAEWLDSESKQLCMNKLHDMEFALGFPEDIKDGYYTDPYIGLEVDKNSYLYSMLNINRFKTTETYEKSIRNDHTEETYPRMKITSINAQYNNDGNKMDIMPGILQDPFFNVKVPMYLNYGGIGFVLGHEATHGFDFDEKIFTSGDSTPAINAAEAEFHNRRDCINTQFEEYVSDTWQLQIDGNKFSRENIADHGGSKVAFNAYKKWKKENGVEPALPGLKYDPLQTYWIALAHTLCGKYNPNMVSELLDVDSHALHEFRVNAPFSNNPDFAKTFDCPSGSPMNPKNRCVVW